MEIEDVIKAALTASGFPTALLVGGEPFVNYDIDEKDLGTNEATQTLAAPYAYLDQPTTYNTVFNPYMRETNSVRVMFFNKTVVDGVDSLDTTPEQDLEALQALRPYVRAFMIAIVNSPNLATPGNIAFECTEVTKFMDACVNAIFVVFRPTGLNRAVCQ